MVHISNVVSSEEIGLDSLSSASDTQVFLVLITGKTFASVEYLAALGCKLYSLVLGDLGTEGFNKKSLKNNYFFQYVAFCSQLLIEFKLVI